MVKKYKLMCRLVLSLARPYKFQFHENGSGTSTITDGAKGVTIPRDNGGGTSSITDGAKGVTDNMDGHNPSTQADTKPDGDEKNQSLSSLPKLNSQKSDDSVPDFDELAARFAALKK